MNNVETDGGGGGNDDDATDDDVENNTNTNPKDDIEMSSSPFHTTNKEHNRSKIELENDGFDEHPSEAFKHFAASVAILAGTAVGSGCLAIPRATAPAGVIPSSSAMTVVWAFLCFSALCIVESVEATSRKMKRKDVPLHAVAEQVREREIRARARFVRFAHVSAVCLLTRLCSLFLFVLFYPH